MAGSKRICADCSERLTEAQIYFGQRRCRDCQDNYTLCSRCGEERHLRDMRQAYCVDCRRTYDRDRWAKQRAARS